MLVIKDLVIANSKDELKSLGNVYREEKRFIEIDGYGFFNFKNNKWPKYFEYQEAWDTHSIGNYNEISKKEVKNILINYRLEYMSKINNIDKVLEQVA